MKFQNGCWLLKEGFAGFFPQQVYDCKVREDEVLLCAPTAVVRGRGNTIDGINLTLRITAPMPEVIRVQVWHHKGAVKRGPAFELNLGNDCSEAREGSLSGEKETGDAEGTGAVEDKPDYRQTVLEHAL